MHCLWRNKVPFYYSLYAGKQMTTDAYGYETGEYKTVYSDPVKIYGNVSSASGQAQVEQFGNLVQYDKVIVIEYRNCPIDENTLLYVDCVPGNDTKPDYVVKRVARSLNSVSYAISKVTIT